VLRAGGYAKKGAKYACCLVRDDFPLPVTTSVTIGTGRRVITGPLEVVSLETAELTMTWATVNCALLRSWGGSRGPLKSLYRSNEDLHLGLTDLQVMRALARRTQRPSRNSVLRSARPKEGCPEQQMPVMLQTKCQELAGQHTGRTLTALAPLGMTVSM
jgi:hypothetical protein